MPAHNDARQCSPPGIQCNPLCRTRFVGRAAEPYLWAGFLLARLCPAPPPLSNTRPISHARCEHVTVSCLSCGICFATAHVDAHFYISLRYRTAYGCRAPLSKTRAWSETALASPAPDLLIAGPDPSVPNLKCSLTCLFGLSVKIRATVYTNVPMIKNPIMESRVLF